MTHNDIRYTNMAADTDLYSENISAHADIHVLIDAGVARGRRLRSDMAVGAVRDLGTLVRGIFHREDTPELSRELETCR